MTPNTNKAKPNDSFLYLDSITYQHDCHNQSINGHKDNLAADATDAMEDSYSLRHNSDAVQNEIGGIIKNAQSGRSSRTRRKRRYKNSAYHRGNTNKLDK